MGLVERELLCVECSIVDKSINIGGDNIADWIELILIYDLGQKLQLTRILYIQRRLILQIAPNPWEVRDHWNLQ